MGNASNNFITPMPTRIAINIKPKDTPSICGSVRLNPKFTPDVISIKLFGPGVTDDARANNTSAKRMSVLINVETQVKWFSMQLYSTITAIFAQVSQSKNNINNI